MLIAVSTHSRNASSKSSGASFQHEVFAWAENRSSSPWGAPNVTNQMWAGKTYKHYENDLNTAGSGIE